MRGLRLLLIVMLATLMDLGAPVLPETPDDFDEFNHAAHGRGRIVWLVAEPAPTPTSIASMPDTVTRPAPAIPRHVVAPRPAPPRKTPSPPPDPASRSTDH
jgi:hypothetical protein